MRSPSTKEELIVFLLFGLWFKRWLNIFSNSDHQTFRNKSRFLDPMGSHPVGHYDEYKLHELAPLKAVW